MHSSRMRTVRSSSHLPGKGGLPQCMLGYVCPRGVSAQCMLGYVCKGGCLPQCMLGYTLPPVNRMTDRQV